MSQKTLSRTRSTTTSSATKVRDVTNSEPELNPVNSWEFKVTGRGTSGWMSWVREGSKWVPLRASETSFISAASAIEPELMRLAFPHHTTKRKAI